MLDLPESARVCSVIVTGIQGESKPTSLVTDGTLVGSQS